MSAPPPSAAPPSRHVVVAGDIIVDRHIYFSGTRLSPVLFDEPGVWVKDQPGGASLLCKLIEKLLAGPPPPKTGEPPAYSGLLHWNADLGVTLPDINATPDGSDGAAKPHGTDSFAMWEPHKKRAPTPQGKPDTTGSKIWRVSKLMGYGPLKAGNGGGLTAPKACKVDDPDIAVFDDAGFLFRRGPDHHNPPEAWNLAARCVRHGGFILLKMSEPVAQGDLWDYLIDNHAQKLVCLVSAHDLRREKLGIGRGLSWEATIEDLRVALQHQEVAKKLTRVEHLVVTFSGDGALWLDLSDKTKPTAHLCCDPGRAEGEWEKQFEGGSLGYHGAMAAALAMELAIFRNKRLDGEQNALDLLPALEAGLVAMRNLVEEGHGEVGEKLPDGYPLERIAKHIIAARNGELKAEERMARITIPWPEESVSAEADWSIVGGSRPPLRSMLLGLAMQVVENGPSVLDGLPHARFGKLVTADRHEIETLRHIRQRMLAYYANPAPKRPLSIGVFGPPGAGKSFGVKQLSDEVFGERAWLEFNLSQFRGPEDLNGAFHEIRDLALGGITPVALWDEFDSRKLYWLQYLLAPMQDGRFQDGPLNHAIGKCVFVFAGGTANTLLDFTPKKEAEAQLSEFRLAKGPDFVSRLDAQMNVLGPNQRSHRKEKNGKVKTVFDPNDLGYPLRRALLIRAGLGCDRNDHVDFDPDLLHALLRIDEFLHGARSLDKLIEILRGDHRLVIRRSNLPRPEQLAMFVDISKFTEKMRAFASGFTALDNKTHLNAVAEAIHNTWLALNVPDGPLDPEFNKPFGKLDEKLKEDNRAAARRIPQVLALAGLGLRPETLQNERLIDPQCDKLMTTHLEAMAEAEHNGWMFHRLRDGWKYDPKRDSKKKHHPGLLPFTKLPDSEKEKDRRQVRNYPKFAKAAGYRVVKLR